MREEEVDTDDLLDDDHLGTRAANKGFAFKGHISPKIWTL